MKYSRPSDREAEEAINLLIRWVGDDPDREGLASTAKHALNFYKKLFKGYQVNLSSIMENALLSNSSNYNGVIIFKNNEFTSYCEHHVVPMKGKINIGYIPDKLILGIGRIVKLVDCFTKRLQLQEKLTVEIAEALDNYLIPKGVIVAIEAIHECVACFEKEDKNNLLLHTSYATGVFQNDMALRGEFFNSIN